MFIMDFQKRIRTLRDLNQLTQQNLADFIGVSRPTISGYETKGYQPSHEKLLKISECFDVTIDYLLNGGPGDEQLLAYTKYPVKQLKIELLQLYSTLSYNNKQKTVEFMRYLVHEDNKTKKQS